MAAPVFPAFLKLEYQDDGSAKSRFIRDVEEITKAGTEKFRTYSATVSKYHADAAKQLDAALSSQRTPGGSLNLGVEQLRAAAAAQQARAVAARELANATAIAAGAESRYTASARQAVAATAQQAAIEEQAAAKALQHAAVVEKVQQVLSRQASAVDAVMQSTRRGIIANDNATASVGAQRAAAQQLSFQLNDVATMWALGSKPMQIFASQAGQTVQALQMLSGGGGKVAAFFRGPWGLALTSAGIVAATLAGEMFKTSDALEKVKFATSAVGDAQSILGGIMDLQTGKITNQSAALRALAEAQLLVARVQAEARAGEARKQVADLQSRSLRLGGGPVGLNIDRRPEDARDYISREVLAGRMTGVDAVDRLKNLQAAGRLTAEEFAQAAAAVASLGVELENLKVYDTAGKLLHGTGGRELLKPASGSGAAAQATADANLGDMKALIQQLFPGAIITAGTNGVHKKGSDHYAGRAIDFVPKGGMGQYSTEDVDRILTEGGVHIRRNAKGTKQLFGPGRSADKPGDHDDHFHVAWQGGVNPDKVAAAAERAKDKLVEMGERSAESIARINEQFNVQPKLIDAAAQATRKLDDIVKDLRATKPAGFEQMIADAEAAKGVVQEALVRPFQNLTRESERRIQIQDLMVSGREAEAAAQQQIWQVEDKIGTEGELREKIQALLVEGRQSEAAVLQHILSIYPELRQGIIDQTAAEQRHNEVLKVRQEMQDNFLNATRSIRGELENLFSGKSANFGQIFKDLQAKVTVEKLFGPALRDLDKFVKGGTGIDAAVGEFNSGATAAGAAATTLADTFVAQANKIRSGGPLGGGGVLATKDNGDASEAAWTKITQKFDRLFSRAGKVDANGDIVVEAGRGTSAVPSVAMPDRNTVGGTTLTAYSEMVASVWTKPMVDAIAGISPELAAKLGPMLNGAIGGYMTGGIPGGILGGLKELPGLGDKLSKELGKAGRGAATGSMVAGLGKAIGLKMSTTGAQVGGAIGSAIPIPGGSLIGSVIGGLLGGLFHKVKSGYAQIRPSGEDVAVTGTYGRTGSLQNDAREAANGLIDTMRSLAERVGGTLGGYDQDVGTKDDKFAVTSSRIAGGTRWFDSEEEAMRFAIRDALSAGAVKGIREGSQRLLQAGSDIERQVAKALDFENVFKRLKSYSDPVGAAIDGVDAEFKRLQGIFKEAGASTAEFADLEKLYGLERAKAVKGAMEQLTGTLKTLVDDLTIGDNGLSLSDRRASALARYQPLADRVKAGDLSASDDFATAARSLLEVQRAMYGSQNPYFELFDEVKNIGGAALDLATSSANQSAGRESPSGQGATSSESGAVVGSINSMSSSLVDRLDAVNTNLGIMIRQQMAPQQANDGGWPMWQPAGNW